jgi:hypothetical protein
MTVIKRHFCGTIMQALVQIETGMAMHTREMTRRLTPSVATGRTNKAAVPPMPPVSALVTHEGGVG